MFVCCVPRNSAEFSRVLTVEQSLFGRFTIPPDIAGQFFGSRPEIYQAVFGPKNTLAAYSSIYPLQPRWAEAFIAGDITEPELKPSMLLERQESLENSTLYIGSLVVSDRYDPVTKSALLASLIAWRAKQLATASVECFSVIMTPVTEHGERLVRHCGARLLNAGSRRKDGCSVYGRKITRGYHTQVVAAVERLLNGSIVEMKYNFWSRESWPAVGPDFGEAMPVSVPALS